MIERETQEVREIELAGLIPAIDALRVAGWRLVQIMGVGHAEDTELNYSFGLGMKYLILRVKVAPGAKVPSVTPVYLAAYLYENEIRDLFALDVERIAVDWLGKTYDVVAGGKFSKLSVSGPCVECAPGLPKANPAGGLA